jgi:hypothetical protein
VLMFSKIKKNILWITVFFIISILAVIPFTDPVLAADDNRVRDSLDSLLGYYNKEDLYDAWEVIGLRWVGVECGAKYKGEDAVSASDYARNIIAAISAGQDKTIVQEYINELVSRQVGDGSFQKAGETLNQSIWAIIALDFAQKNGLVVNYQRDNAVAFICNSQDDSGGFNESGWGVDVDSTAHALIALAPDYQKPGKDHVTKAINDALAYLHQEQIETGGFGGWGAENPDTTAAVIEAFMALGINPVSEEWLFNEKSMVDALLSYQSQEGWFVYSWDVSAWNDPNFPNVMSTCHALLALGDLMQGKSKYNSVIPGTNSILLTVEAPASFSLDSDANVNIKVANSSAGNKPVLVMVGLYNRENERLFSMTSTATVIPAGNTIEFGSGITTPVSGSYELRVFLWDDWDNRNPLTVPTVIPL